MNGKSKLTTEGDLNLTAANVGFGQGADITADNVNITGLALNEMHSKETHSSTSLDIGILKMEVSGTDEATKTLNFDATKMQPTDTAWAGSNIATGGALNIKANKDILIEGSNIVGASDKADISLDAGKTLAITSAETNSSYDYTKETRNLDLIKSLNPLGNIEVKDNGIEVTMATYTGTGEHTAQNNSSQAASNIVTSGKFVTKSGADTVVLASNVQAKSVDMTAEGSITVMSAEEMQNLLQEASELTIKLKTRVGNQYVDLAAQIEGAVNQIGDVSKGESASDTAKAAKALQAVIATARAANAVKAAADTAASTPALGFYLEASLERTETKTSSETNDNTAKKSSIVATGGDLSLKANEKVSIIGSDLASTQGNITLSGKTGVDVISAEELNSLTSAYSQNTQKVSVSTKGGLDLPQYTNSTSSTKGDANSNANSTLFAANGTLKIVTEGDFNMSGANGLAKKVDLTDVVGNINLESKQDTASKETNSQTISVGKKMGYSVSKATEESSWTSSQTTLIGTESVNVGGKELNINGAVLANAEIQINADGTSQLIDKGNMQISSEKITIRDIKDSSKKESESYGGGFSAADNITGAPSSVQVNFGNTKDNQEQTSFGALGSYTKISTDGSSEAVAANQDLNTSQKITKTEKLDNTVSLDVDTEMLTNTAGYINKSVTNLTNVAKNTTTITNRVADDAVDIKDAAVAGITKGVDPLKDYQNSFEFKQATVQFQQDHPELTAILNNKEKADSAEYKQALQTYTNYVQKSMDSKLTNANLYDSNKLAIKTDEKGTVKDGKGMTDMKTGDTYLNIGKVDMTNTNEVVGTQGHEIIHSTGERNETVAERGTEQAQNAWQRENGYNNNITGGGYANGGEFYQTNKNSPVIQDGSQQAVGVKDAAADAIVYLVPDRVGYMGHTGKYFQDANGKWYQSDLAIGSDGFSAIDTLKTFGKAFITNDLSSVDLVGKANYNVREVDLSFDPQKFMQEHPETATYYPTTQAQDEYITKFTFDKKSKFDAGELYGLKNNNCNETEYGILNKAGVNTSKVTQPVPVIQWGIEKTKEMYYEQLGLESLRKKANTNWQAP